MLFSNRDHEPEHGSRTLRIVRDIVEVVAIVAAGVWAFYVFVYENRIKPSFEDPQVSFEATLQKTSERAGAVGVLLKTEVRNTGATRAYFIGYAVTVLGTRVTLSPQPLPPARSDTEETTQTFFKLSKPVAVYGFGFVTTLGNPASLRGLSFEPGGTADQEHTFFIPASRFDLLSTRVDGCLMKYADRTLPAQLKYGKSGVAGVTCHGGIHFAYDVGSLDLRR